MIAYEVSAEKPHRHFISFRARFETRHAPALSLRLAAWRPGRYELGNFSKNIRAWHAFGEGGEPLSFRKADKDTWVIACAGHTHITITYQYYAAELNAGSSYLDERQLYLNPVNCFFYDPGAMGQPYTVRFALPEEYTLVCGLEKEGDRTLHAAHFDQLADSPLIASASLHHHEYRAGDAVFHLHAQGGWNLDTARVLSDFAAFTKAQLDLFGGIPCRQYAFLFQFTPYFIRHGVEHATSTVIAMGPLAELPGEKLYNELLAISSHELFHTWNIKCIRPAEMLPYDFSKENYSEQGYVFEGVTTYYGDLMLMRSGVWSRDKWLSVFSDEVKDHMENPGALNHSVAASGMDTWLDGYSPGIPWRKVSIYTEGCLAAFMCDIMVMRATGNRASLDDAMRTLYRSFGLQGRGYSAADYIGVLEQVSGHSFGEFYREVLCRAGNYKNRLDDCLGYIGCTLRAVPSPRTSEAGFGFGADESNGRVVVTWVDPESPADDAGLWIGDEITAVNGTAAVRSFQHLLSVAPGESVTLTVSKKMRVVSLLLVRSERVVRYQYSVVRQASVSEAQERNWAYFCSRTNDT